MVHVLAVNEVGTNAQLERFGNTAPEGRLMPDEHYKYNGICQYCSAPKIKFVTK